MLFVGEQLREMIDRNPSWIELRNEHNRYCRMLSSAEVAALDLDLFEGIGNWRRIKFIRIRTRETPINASSHTTRRLKGEGEVNIAHPLIREHRRVPVQGVSALFPRTGR
jgi:hypothetical protein